MKTQENVGHNSIVLTFLLVCFILGTLGICALTNYQGLFELVFSREHTTIKIDGLTAPTRDRTGGKATNDPAVPTPYRGLSPRSMPKY